jgi:hypothetical protein
MPNLTRTVNYKVNEEVSDLGEVVGRIIIHKTSDPKYRLTLCKLESKTDIRNIDYDSIPTSRKYHGRLEVWMNCDSKSLVFKLNEKGFIDNDAYKAYLTFAYDCLRAVVELEDQKNNETKKTSQTK